jgi:hypothetical protein
MWALALLGVSYAAPVQLSQSGRALDALGRPIEGPASVVVQLYPSLTSTTLLHTSAFSGVPVDDGYYTVVVGSQPGSPLDSAVFSTNPEVWLAVTVAGQAVGPRQRLVAVPVAAFAHEAATVTGGVGSPFFCSSGGGTWCPDGYVCGAGTCSAELGMASANPATSCGALHTARPAFHDGAYWLDPEADGGAFRAYCLMDDAGGGWTLVARVNGANGQNLNYPVWAGTGTVGSANDLDPLGAGDALYPAYAAVAGQSVLFYDATSTCGTSKRLLQTGTILGSQTLRSFLVNRPTAPANSPSANLYTPEYRNTGCNHVFNPSANGYYAGNALGVNIQDGVSDTVRFAVTTPDWDTGIGSAQTPTASYGSGDLDILGNGVDPWTGHVVTVWVK